MTGTRRRGEQLELALLDSALELIGDVGYGRLTMEAVAEHAGTGKAVLYRRWPDKRALVLAALAGTQEDLLATPESGDLRTDLIAVLTSLRDLLDGRLGAALTGLMAARDQDPGLHAAVQRTAVGPRHRAIRRALQAAVDRGELEPDALDSEALRVGSALLIYHFLTEDRPLRRALPERIVDTVVLPALAAHRP